MEDFIVLNAGYQTAIKDSLEILKDLQDFDIITDRLLRLSDRERTLKEKNGYLGKILKYYDKENNMGYVIKDDIYNIEGNLLLLDIKRIKKLTEKELVFVKNTMKPSMIKEFKNEEELDKEYGEIINKFKENP